MPLIEPLTFFNFLFLSILIQNITEQTNICALQICPDKLPNMFLKEIEQCIGICFKMSVYKLPSVLHH